MGYRSCSGVIGMFRKALIASPRHYMDSNGPGGAEARNGLKLS